MIYQSVGLFLMTTLLHEKPPKNLKLEEEFPFDKKEALLVLSDRDCAS